MLQHTVYKIIHTTFHSVITKKVIPTDNFIFLFDIYNFLIENKIQIHNQTHAVKID